jgi:TatD DNase family protein
MLIDTHCHLDADEFDRDRDALVHAARAADVGAMVVPSVGPGNWAAVRECCSRYPGCYPAYGIHPLYIQGIEGADLQGLRKWIGAELKASIPPVAVGEIGLDFFLPDQDVERQEFLFLEQLKIARDFDLPVLVHVRRAVDRVLKCLRRVRVRGGIAHAFNGSLQQAEAFVGLNFKLGLGGAMTYSGSKRIRRLATTLSIASLVLETDAPDIPPSWIGGKRNTPPELVGIADTLSRLRGLSSEDVALATSQNAREVLGLDTCRPVL